MSMCTMLNPALQLRLRTRRGRGINCGTLQATGYTIGLLYLLYNITLYFLFTYSRSHLTNTGSLPQAAALFMVQLLVKHYGTTDAR